MGKILRLNDSGHAPQDNPFSARVDTEKTIWCYGHRNIQGLAYDSLRNVGGKNAKHEISIPFHHCPYVCKLWPLPYRVGILPFSIKIKEYITRKKQAYSWERIHKGLRLSSVKGRYKK
ncbi:PQQ-dependent sugar dehydrogenase [Desulfosarcina variabilis]|uniref:PQQ-dependent sugar dehydrogenase n=1 Tax=Desulfosarcina variabilis TaxID=2300 RepID=UPI003AFA2BD0